MNYITKYELDNKELASKFSIENGNLVFDENWSKWAVLFRNI